MTKKVLVIEIEHTHDGEDADQALDRVARDVTEYAKDRARRMLCPCAKVTVQETREDK